MPAATKQKPAPAQQPPQKPSAKDPPAARPAEAIAAAPPPPNGQPAPRSAQRIEASLAAYFLPAEVEWKAQTVTKDGGRALMVAYIDARCVQDRLDKVLGVGGWQDSYQFLDGGNVLCRLSLRIAGDWVSKEDVGGPSDQPDAGDRGKAAVSDALKRAAVKFGIGRYLYSLPSVWVDWDAAGKRPKNAPQLPDWAKPPAKPRPSILERLQTKDAELTAAGLCLAGELLTHVRQTGTKAGFPADVRRWEWGREGPVVTGWIEAFVRSCEEDQAEKQAVQEEAARPQAQQGKARR